MKWFLCSFLTFLLLGCDQKIPQENFFPLHKGLVWNYRVSTMESDSDKTTVDYFSMRNLGKKVLPGEYADQTVHVRQSSEGTDYYILQDEAGSFRVAKRRIVELKPQLDATQRKILPGFRDLEVGRSWQVESQPYLLRSAEFHSLPEPNQQRFILSYEISATGVDLTVPAGTFRNCIEVTGQGQISLYADPRLGYQDIFITQKEWYAPGVGLVKLSRAEPLELPMFKGGEVVFELTSFER